MRVCDLQEYINRDASPPAFYLEPAYSCFSPSYSDYRLHPPCPFRGNFISSPIGRNTLLLYSPLAMLLSCQEWLAFCFTVHRSHTFYKTHEQFSKEEIQMITAHLGKESTSMIVKQSRIKRARWNGTITTWERNHRHCWRDLVKLSLGNNLEICVEHIYKHVKH